MPLTPQEAGLLKRYLTQYTVTPAQKAALDELYVSLLALASQESASRSNSPAPGSQ